MEKVSVTVSVDGNMLEITPDEVKDSSKYTIKISGIKNSDDTKEMPTQTFTVITAVTPYYCTLEDLKAVTEGFGISDETMLHHIRSASEFADFVASTTKATGATLLFSKGELTKVRATLDCLMASFVGGTFAGSGKRWKLGEDELEEADKTGAFKNLLDWLKWLLQYWMDAVRGYVNPGRTPPKATRLGINAADNSNVQYITVDSLVRDFTRDVPQWS